MQDSEDALNSFALRYCRLLVADVPDGELADQPVAGATHPAWVLGHLAVAADFAIVRLGGTPSCPPEWRQLFGPNSVVRPDRLIYPGKHELLTAVETGYGRLQDAVRGATPEALARAQPGPFYLEDFPTVGGLVAHLMTTHPCLHLGQLSAWRRMKGLPSALGI